MFGRTKNEATQGKAATPTVVELWGPNDWCNQHVAGESHYEPALRALFGREAPRGVELKIWARLVPEPGNAHDANAVAVEITGQKVGYLPRADAARYQPLLLDLARRGLVAQVPCRVWGQTFEDYEYDERGRHRQVERFSGSVTLALAEPHLCLPINSPPAGPHVMLPSGSVIQISGEEDCMAALASCLRPEGACMVHATLHEISGGSTRSPKPLVEVRIDGQRAGQLTPKMSGDLLPAIRHLDSLGYVTAARAEVEGNQLKAEVVLRCSRAHQLPPDWPSVPALSTDQTKGGASDHGTDMSGDVAVAPLPSDHLEHGPVPPKPTRIVFSVPPGWPPPPEGWEPNPGWCPDPSWPPAPAGWVYWRTDG